MHLRRNKFISGLLIVLLVCSFTNTYAVEDQFEVSLTVGADVSAPTAPTGLSATAISSSQIDLSWSASTDDVGVVGYRIYRDSVHVATSTGTTYSDVGLSAETTYTYTVSAIDAAYNESSQSSSAQATTLGVAAPPSGGGTPSQPIVPIIYDLVVLPSGNSATISWKTTLPSLSKVSWGVSQNYELGQSQGIIYSTTHSVSLSGLSSGTLYNFFIEVVSPYGARGNSGNQVFVTPAVDLGRENARNFVATAKENSILLSWQNPSAREVESIRLVKNTSYFPGDPNDGEVIYEGREESFEDFEVEIGKRFYYALFVKYSDGSYSSGLLAEAKILKPGEVAEPFDPFDGLPKAPRVHPLINLLTFADFDFIQDGRILATLNNGESVSIDGTKALKVSLKYEKVPEVLKSIVVTLSLPSDSNKTFSFLLRVNEEKTAYEATIAPLGETGTYGVKISIVDYKNQGLKKIVGSLLASAVAAFEENSSIFSSIKVFLLEEVWNLLLLLILLFLIYRGLKGMVDRQKQREEKEKIKN